MKKILVIGSTVVDMIVNVDKLPTSKADIHIKSQRANMGGCAFNVYDIIDKFGCPNILFSPVGGGIYGGFVRNYFESNNISTPISRLFISLMRRMVSISGGLTGNREPNPK